MSFATWNEDLATGIEAIDNDHRMLFDLIDQFHEAYMKPDNKKAMEPVFSVLMDYTNNHFRREEELLEEVGYPELEEHKEGHKDLKNEVIALHQRFLNDELQGDEKDLGLELLAFLKNWLDFHIRESDMHYRDFIVSKQNK